MARIRFRHRRALISFICSILIFICCYGIGSICWLYFAPAQGMNNVTTVDIQRSKSGSSQPPILLQPYDTKGTISEQGDSPTDMRHQKVELALDEVLRVFESSVPSIPNSKTILIVSSWRSGSTFFAEVINSHPAVYYHYEPWTNYETKSLRRRSSPDLKEALETVNHLKNCNYFNVSKYIQVAANDGSMLQRNDKLHHACEYLGLDCYDPDFLSKVCHHFPIQLFKFVKANVADFQTLMSEDSQVYVILLVRDPRAIYASRQKLEWCQEDPYCINVIKMCKFLEKNLQDATQLHRNYPSRTLIIGFEEMAMNPLAVFKKLFQDLHIPWDRQVHRFLNEHTSKNIDEPWSTFRIPKDRISKWNETLEPFVVQEIESTCQTFIKEYSMSFPPTPEATTDRMGIIFQNVSFYPYLVNRF